MMPDITTNEELQQQQQQIKYGELVVLGYNGQIPSGDRGRRKSKFQLRQRTQANGLKAQRQHLCKNADEVQKLTQADFHSISYTLSRNQTVVVQYAFDEDSDMFQIGRSSENQIDCIVMDTVAGAKTFDDLTVPQSTISRYACRIVVSRHSPYTARIFAAGFDASKNIFLGEKSIKWKNDRNEMDGVTTNGILVMHSEGDQFDTNSKPTKWKEVSVGGSVFDLGEGRLKFNYQLTPPSNTDNILKDGSLIDLCGATLLWRSVEGLKNTPTRRLLEMELDQLNSKKPQCPVGLNTLIIKSQPFSSTSSTQPNAYVYVLCGHVHGNHKWGVKNDNSESRECPLCRTVGPLIPIIPGIEPAFYIIPNADNESTTSYCFHPCGHMTSQSTALYWSKIKVPYGTKGLKSICPFCSIALSETKPFVRLIFQDSIHSRQ
ncbi:unnamed protein product [Adineta steineri]|uniref:Pellino n=1 Tax=Adineta steineri TaxID=433720 RepID=A0A815NXR6_9BILA|nr:unnamed protein product [Adineta steineri]CAF3493791.1 unnamed protein product [Adineta steineri]